jgi:hypothetical protein
MAQAAKAVAGTATGIFCYMVGAELGAVPKLSVLCGQEFIDSKEIPVVGAEKPNLSLLYSIENAIYSITLGASAMVKTAKDDPSEIIYSAAPANMPNSDKGQR